MVAIPVKVTKKESEAIKEYARMCAESTSDLMRKITIQTIALKNGDLKDPKIHECSMLIPDNISEDTEQKIIEANYNKIREILGWNKISFGWK